MSELANQANERAIAREDPAKATVLDLIRQQEKAIAVALPRHMDSDRFTRTILTEVRRNPRLLECDPMSLLASCMLSAQLGLELGPLGHCYLVPFKREVTFIIGYRGMVDLAYRSGRVSFVQAYAVHEADQFDYCLGLNPDITHKPAEGDRGALTHVYAVAHLKEGSIPPFVVLTKADVEKYKARSASVRAKRSSPWDTDYEAMAMKTAVRRLFPWMPSSPEIAAAVSVDETQPRQITTDIVSDLALNAPADPETGEIIDVEAVEDDEPDVDAWVMLADLLGAGPPPASKTKDEVMAAVQKLAFAVTGCGLAPVTAGINASMGKDDLVAAAAEAWQAAGIAYANASDEDYGQQEIPT